jgi:hypothetical protein
MLSHCMLFALPTWRMGLSSGSQGKQRLMTPATGALLVGMLDEYHQAYLPGREAGLDGSDSGYNRHRHRYCVPGEGTNKANVTVKLRRG